MYIEKRINISSDLKRELLESLKINQPKIGYSSGEIPKAIEVFFSKYGRVDMKYVTVYGGKQLVDTSECFVWLNNNEAKHHNMTKISVKEIINQLIYDGDIILEKVQGEDKDGNPLFWDENKTKTRYINFHKIL